MIEIWNNIKTHLIKKKYKINEIQIKDDYNYNKAIENVKKGKYDIVIGDFFVTGNRKKIVNFSSSLFRMLPLIIYDPNDQNVNRIKYISYLIEIWIVPFIILIIGAIIVSIIFYSGRNGNSEILKTFYYSIAGFFGQTGGILSYTHTKKMKSVFFSIFCFFIIYFFSVYVNAVTTAKSVQFFQKSHKMDYSIKNEKILVDAHYVSSLIVPKNGGIPFDVNKLQRNLDGNIKTNRFELFLENKKKYKLSGFLYVELDDPYSLASKYGLKVSPLILGSYKVAFPINKNKKKLLNDINEIIQSLEDKGTNLEVCDDFASTKYIIC